MKIFAAVVAIAATALYGAMDARAAGYSTTKSNIKNLGAEQCDPKVDKNCAAQPETKVPDAPNSKSAKEVKVVPPSEAATKLNASKSGVDRQGSVPNTNRSVSGTIVVRDMSAGSKAPTAQRTGDPLPDVDVSLPKKTGGDARVKAP